MADDVPAFSPYKKPTETLEQKKARDAANPWKKDWQGNGLPTPVDQLPTYEEWKRQAPGEP